MDSSNIYNIRKKRYFVVFRHKFQDDIIQRQRWYYIISVLSQIYISKNVSNKTKMKIFYSIHHKIFFAKIK